MPPAVVKNVKDLIFRQYGKIILISADIRKKDYGFAITKFKQLRQGEISWNEIRHIRPPFFSEIMPKGFREEKVEKPPRFAQCLKVHTQHYYLYDETLFSWRRKRGKTRFQRNQ